MIAFIHANLQYDLDHLRHFMAWGFNPNNWFTNGTEQIIALLVGAVISYFLWPRLHAKIDSWVKAHVRAGNAELHAKLDIITHHHNEHAKKLDALLREKDATKES